MCLESRHKSCCFMYFQVSNGNPHSLIFMDKNIKNKTSNVGASCKGSLVLKGFYFMHS